MCGCCEFYILEVEFLLYMIIYEFDFGVLVYLMYFSFRIFWKIYLEWDCI